MTVSSYQAEPSYARKAYIEPLKVGDPLPTMPLFIISDRYINLPLEATYAETWSKLPHQVQRVVKGPGLAKSSETSSNCPAFF